MSFTFDAFLRSWPVAPWLAAALIATAILYVRGWRWLRRRDPSRWSSGRLYAFLSGLGAFYLALASPIESFASLFLQVHMLQHLLLMMVAPPLVWLGWPLIPIVRGLPEPIRVYWVLPILKWRSLRRLFSTLAHPLVAWPTFVVSTWFWHLPRVYEWGLQSDAWHVIQHACFIASACLFWYPVVCPYPSRPRWPKWLLFPYLLLADVQNTVLAAWLTFSPSVIYSYYSQIPMVGGITALEDQRTAGALMWVPGSIAFLLPLFWIGVRHLFEAERKPDQPKRSGRRAHVAAPAVPFDLLKLPAFGRFLRWRHSRRVLQFTLLVLVALVILDGMTGPQVAAMNFAGVLPWIHWRGMLVLGLLAVGNLSCMACPFTLPRSLARRWFPTGMSWPRSLRNKWLAVAAVVLFLWSYEAFALWDNPWITAWIAVGYFLAAFVIDTVFAGASFCKYVCPIGQFNFVQSLVSPLEVAVREPSICTACKTHDCIRGRDNLPGCGTELFLPRKVGNMDCTLCLDCVHACPQQNVGVLVASPLVSLAGDSMRSGIGRLSQRPDLAALVLVLVFGAFANAAGMVAPVVKWQDWLCVETGATAFVVRTFYYAIALLVAPLAVGYLAAQWSCRWTSPSEPWFVVGARFAFALVPIGFAMWLAHYTFHFFTSWQTIVPVAQRFLTDFAPIASVSPDWQCACCANPAVWITYAQLLMLDVGVLASLYVGFRLAESNTLGAGRAVGSFAPWAALITVLFMVGTWITFQPMEMRGTLLISP